MKDLKPQPPLASRSPIRSVSLQIRDYQVTLKVNTPVPQIRSSASRPTIR